MAAHTGLIFPGCHRHQDRRAYGVAQANDPVGERGGPIETFDSRLQVEQFAQRSLQTWGGAYYADIVTHDVFDETHILLDEGWIGYPLAHLLPGRNVVGRKARQVMEMLLNGVRHAIAPHEPLKQAGTGQTIRPMQSCARDLAHRIEPTGRRLSPLLHPDTPTGIVRSGAY